VRHDERIEAIHEATVMILYVSVVEIAELAALPETHFPDGHVSGPGRAELLAIVWGTALGLALAHWFAFQVAAPAFRGEHTSRHDVRVGLAQVSGAVVVAVASSLPIVFLSDLRAQETTRDLPAVLIGIVGYLLARRTGKSRRTAVFYGVTALAVGVLVALVKSTLAAH